MKTKLTIEVDTKIHKKYKAFCKKNGIVMSKRLEGLMAKDISEILVGIPKL
ncbi:MAG TPA: hypothetical protein HA224_05060 [Nanoarchaeota archaeon]|nr:hypothetical protein [Nanoarchaeota archaeon]